MAIEEHRPVALILSRQNIKNLPALNHSRREEAGPAFERRLYRSRCRQTGCGDAWLRVRSRYAGRRCRVAFEGGNRGPYRERAERRTFPRPAQILSADVLPQGVVRYGLTSGLPVTLLGLVGENGMIHGLDHFGYSAPYKVLDEKFGYNGQTVYEEVKKLIGK